MIGEVGVIGITGRILRLRPQARLRKSIRIVMHEFWQRLAEQWAHIGQQLALIQAQPTGIAGTVTARLLEIGQWLHEANGGVLLLLLGLAVFTRRFLRHH